MAHQGQLSGGRYGVYIKQDPGGVWVKFEDEQVSQVSSDKALRE